MQEKHLYLPSAETINEWKRSLLRVPEQDKNCSTIKQGSTLLAFLLCCHKGQEKLNQAADERNLQEASWDWRNLGSFKQDVQIQEQSIRSPAPPACWCLSALSEIEMFPLLWLAQLPSSSGAALPPPHFCQNWSTRRFQQLPDLSKVCISTFPTLGPPYA